MIFWLRLSQEQNVTYHDRWKNMLGNYSTVLVYNEQLQIVVWCVTRGNAHCSGNAQVMLSLSSGECGKCLRGDGKGIFG
jgi:hypothetical protein